MGIVDRTSSISYKPWVSFVWVLAVYLLMGWPILIPTAGQFATFHRWTCVAILFYKLWIYAFAFIKVPIPQRLVPEDPGQAQGTKRRCSVSWIQVPGSWQIFLMFCLAPAFGQIPMYFYTPLRPLCRHLFPKFAGQFSSPATLAARMEHLGPGLHFLQTTSLDTTTACAASVTTVR